VDDHDYLGRVLGDLVARGVIEGSNAVYLAGISNGGGMALEAARRNPDRFRGIAALMPYAGEHFKPVPDLAPTKVRRRINMERPCSFEVVRMADELCLSRRLGHPLRSASSFARMGAPRKGMRRQLRRHAGSYASQVCLIQRERHDNRYT